jgi:hypothetical protein
LGRITNSPRNIRVSTIVSEGRHSHRNRFQQADAYAREAAETQPLYAALARNTPASAYTLARSDWLHAPVIHDVIRQKDSIFVDATDNVLVTRVVITISSDQEQIVTQGEADLVDDAWWEYETSIPDGATILVEAFDLAGNVTRYED